MLKKRWSILLGTLVISMLVSAQIPAETGKAEEERLAKQPKVTNIFDQTDIRQVLMDIATQTGVNIIPDQTVEGVVSLELKRVPLETALRMILFPGGYTFKKEGDYYLVGSANPESSTFGTLSITKTILTNMAPQKVAERLSSHFSPYFMVNREGGNSITLTGPPEIVSRIEEDIEKVDRPREQIEIDVLVTSVEWQKGSNIGIDWGDITLDAAAQAGAEFQELVLSSISPVYTLDIVGTMLDKIQSLGRKAEIKVRANPKVVTSDGEEAEIKLTQEEYVLILAGGGMQYSYFTTKTIESGVLLKVTPSITREGEINLDIEPEVSDVVGEKEFKMAGAIQKLPIISRRSEKTFVRVKDGQTVTIGGLYLQSEKKVEKSLRLPIPLIGDLLCEVLSRIPIINFLLVNKEQMSKNSELVIFLTPRIL